VKTKVDIRALILDMDGVLWRDNLPIGNLAVIFERVVSLGWQVTLATNNATRSTDQYLEKLAKFGVTLSNRQIVTSAHAVTSYLQETLPTGSNVFLVGEPAFKRMLMEHGFQISDEKVAAVVASLDRAINYEKLAKATSLIRAGAPFIATNPDPTFPTPEGLIPGAGSILAAIEAASGAKPKILGKPSPGMYQVAMQRMQVTPEKTVVIGDRLETDIMGAQRIGCLTGLVLSGVTSPETAATWQPAPDWIASDLSALIDILAANSSVDN